MFNLPMYRTAKWIPSSEQLLDGFTRLCRPWDKKNGRPAPSKIVENTDGTAMIIFKNSSDREKFMVKFPMAFTYTSYNSTSFILTKESCEQIFSKAYENHFLCCMETRLKLKPGSLRSIKHNIKDSKIEIELHKDVVRHLSLGRKIVTLIGSLIPSKNTCKFINDTHIGFPSADFQTVFAELSQFDEFLRLHEQKRASEWFKGFRKSRVDENTLNDISTFQDLKNKFKFDENSSSFFKSRSTPIIANIESECAQRKRFFKV